MGFTKLFSDIICSSIWNEDDKTRIVWITLLAIKGPNHVARATVGALAHQARVSVEDCRTAIDKLCSPDPDGLDQPHEGRRIMPVEHGWLVLNGEAYRLRRDGEDRKQYMAQYMRDYRRKQSVNNRKQSLAPVSIVSPSDQIRSDQIRSDQKISHESKNQGDPRGNGHAPVQGRSGERQPESWDVFLAYALKKGCSRDEATYFFSTWEANGWTTSSKPMKSWKAKIVSWHTAGYYQPTKK